MAVVSPKLSKCLPGIADLPRLLRVHCDAQDDEHNLETTLLQNWSVNVVCSFSFDVVTRLDWIVVFHCLKERQLL